MKFSTSTILVSVAFVFIVFISLYGGCNNFQPYSFGNSSLQGHPYEGFSSTGYPDNALIDSMTIEKSAITDKTRIKGFDGLYGATTLDDSSIDIFSKAQGKGDCQSYGLMNSKGYLCLDATQKALLTSRGGNASGN